MRFKFVTLVEDQTVVQVEAPKSLHWVACGTCYTKKEGTELGGIELQRSS